MPGLSFLSKKSWHTSNISNQEKVWIAEQKAAAEEAKLKELTQQIKLEREQEELLKITGQKSSSSAAGDRGVDWMYEGHKKGDGDEEQLRKKVQEDDAQNEAYLLGKEYVPEGQEKRVGDFAVAASMTGALEKASTVGASIGVGGNNNSGEEGTVLRIQDDGMNNNNGTAGSSSVAAASSTMNDWNQNFHLRHEDPMFSVMQRKQAKDKDVEKKIKLMERAGMEVVVKGTTEPVVAEKKKMQHDEQEDKRRERRRRKDSSKKSKKKRKHKHKSHRRHHHKRSRSERSRSPSDDGYSSYSSSGSYSSEDSRRDRHRGRRRKDDETKSSRRRHDDDDDDDYDGRHSSDRRRDRHDDDRDRDHRRDDRDHRRKRSESRERRRRERSSEKYDDYDDRYERQSKRSSTSGRRGKRSRSHSRDREDPKGERRSRGDNYRDSKQGGDRSSMGENGHHGFDNKKQPAKEAAAPESDSRPKKEGYGLIGTSISNKSNNNIMSSKSSSNCSGDYLGPDQKLREAKREEMERERQSRFGQGLPKNVNWPWRR